MSLKTVFNCSKNKFSWLVSEQKRLKIIKKWLIQSLKMSNYFIDIKIRKDQNVSYLKWKYIFLNIESFLAAPLSRF